MKSNLKEGLNHLIRNHTIFTLYCAILFTLLPLGCGENINEPTDCGDPLTLTNIPATPILGGYPTLTNQNAVTLFGTKSPNTNVVINVNNAEPLGVEVVPSDCLTTWAADLSLSDGPNSLEIFSVNGIGGAGPSAQISITKQAPPLPPPSSKVPGRLLCDINKDAYDDVIVGSYENDADGKKNVGRVFIYHAGPSGPDTGADVVLTGEAAEDRFGISAACAGDINGDGFGDIIVGAFLNDVEGTDAGRAYIFFGGSPMNSVPDVILGGQAADDQFGTSVSAAGDVNGEGYDDVIVGAYRNDGGGRDAGRTYIYLGGPSDTIRSLPGNLPDVVL